VPYPKRLLQDGEELRLDLQPHWFFFVRQILVSIPLLLIGLVILAKLNGDVKTVSEAVWGFVFLVYAVWVLIKYLDWRFTHFVVTSRRVVFRTGVVSKKGVEIPLSRINNINFSQGVVERMIGTGDLEIESAGRDGQSVFDNVRHPDGVQQEIYRMMEEDERTRTSRMSGGAASAPTVAPAASVPDQIEQLARLRDQGAITPQEYEAKKAELLKRM
jgi:uncharacterized membrane protein YdbT with pleckstrin-like domain